MRMNIKLRIPLFLISGVFLASLVSPGFADDDDNGDSPQGVFVSNGTKITPTAVPRAQLQLLNPHLADFPSFVVSGGISSVASPDGKTLFILVSGHNALNDATGSTIAKDSSEYVFIYDISSGVPVEKQVLSVPNSFVGSLGHTQGVGLVSANTPYTQGIDIPVTSGLDVTADGTHLVVANLYNDSASIIDLAGRKVSAEIDLRPGKNDPAQSGVPGGEYPFGVAIKGNDTAYVSSLRDREIVVVNFGAQTPSILGRIKTDGNPNKLILNHAQTKLFVTEDNSDRVSIIDTATNQIVSGVKTVGPEWLLRDLAKYHGAVPNSLTLSPDEKTLYVTNGGTNSVAVIDLHENPFVLGLLPTGFYPSAVSVSQDGKRLYVVNAKSPTGPNPNWIPKDNGSVRASHNDKVTELEQSSLLSFPIPDFFSFEQLTFTVAANNSFLTVPRWDDAFLIGVLRQRIKHVIYVIKENRTYDQVLGDLDRGNGDPALTEFGAAITPNFHRLAAQFCDLDNFFDSGDVSANGWPWTVSAKESDFGIKATPLNYSSRGTDYEYEGINRNMNMGLATNAERRQFLSISPSDPDILPGTGDVAAPDGPAGTQKQGGYIWSAALRANLTIRNYGCFVDGTRYNASPLAIPLERYPFTKNLRVAYPSNPELQTTTDPYFRGIDLSMPDYYREWEWEREFTQFENNGQLPNLELVRLGRDHTGSYNTSLDGTNTPELDQSDNDYAVGRLIERVAHSRYKYDTVIFVIEDDAQDGADHVDAHRSVFYVAGPYVKHGAVVSKRYTTVNVVRTIEDILGTDHLNINTATQRPLNDLFDLGQREWTYKAVPSAYLKGTQLPIPASEFASYKRFPSPTHSARYWAEKTKRFDFSREDHLYDPEKYNRIVWKGLKGNIPYPAAREGKDLRENRKTLLEKRGLTTN
jgi:YVTN family beta-propeller protein